MKSGVLCVLSLLAAVALAGAIGHQPTAARWGDEGIRSMQAIGVICLGAALIGAAPLFVVARRWPDYLGQALLAGTALRLLVTMAAAAAYQIAVRPHLPSFLFWAVAFYLLLLVVETAFSVAAVRRHFRRPRAHGGVTT